ncbi:MAG: ferritin-like domain-containing protein [Actinomycetota bacterium]|nr:ferritin-like domain-containing protein [Actinomycetota bacterium]
MTHEPPAPLAFEGAGAEVVTTEWRRRTVAEYTSAAIAHHVTLWLIQLGAPPDLIRDGLRIVDDELVHSELSAKVADAAGGDPHAAILDAESLTLPGDDPATALICSILRHFCIGETLAVPLFRMLRQRCSVPIARLALDRILRDETRHRQFGWDVLDWVFLAGGPSTLQSVADVAPGMLSEVVSVYAIGDGHQAQAGANPQAIAWGLASPLDYATTVSTALATDVSARFAARGVEPHFQ